MLLLSLSAVEGLIKYLYIVLQLTLSAFVNKISSIVKLSILSGISGSTYVIRWIRNSNTAEAGASVRWQCCTFHYYQCSIWIKPSFQFSLFIFIFASERSYHQNLCISTVAGVNCLCGGRKMSPCTSSLVQLSILTGISGWSNVLVSRCIRNLNNA